MRDTIKGKPPLDLYQAVREIACRLDEVIDYLNHNDPAFGDVYVRTFNGQTGDVVGVSSVNGQTGDVVISAVDSVNGKTGEVTLTGDDISLSASDDQSVSGVIDTLYGPGNPPPYPVTSVNGQTGDVEISTGGGAVDSVNGKTGAVLLTASDINATAGGTVQQNIDAFSSSIDDLGNDVNTLQRGVSSLETDVDGKYSSSNPPPYPVTSVNNKTGDVTGLYDVENPPPYPVTSVNNRTGDVTGVYDAENPPPYPVTSVNGITGAVNVEELRTYSHPSFYARYFYSDHDQGIQVGTGSGQAFNISKDFNGNALKYWFEYNSENGELYSSGNPPPYPVKSARVTTTLYGDTPRHRISKSSLPDLDTSISVLESIVSIFNSGSVPMVFGGVTDDGNNIIFDAWLLGANPVNTPQTLTFIYK